MKKILFLFLIYVVGFVGNAWAIDEPIRNDIEPIIELEAQQNSIKISEPKLILQQEEHSSFYNQFSKTMKDVFELEIEQTDKPSWLLGDKLTWNIDKGPIEKLHLWGVLQTNMDMTFVDGDTTTKFKPSLINILLDGTFRGGKEEFRFMIDPTPQSTRPYFQPFFQDAYIQTKRIPHHKVLVGNSRPKVGYEGSLSPYTLPFVMRSQLARNFGTVRKLGVRVMGDYSLVDYEVGGYSSGTFFSSFFPGAEFNSWINIKPLGKTDGRYGKLVLGGGLVGGERYSTDFLVTQTYLGYQYKKFWARAEYASADGSNGMTGFSDKRRDGWYLSTGYFLTPKVEVLARYDEFDADKRISNNNQREYTAGLNYYVKGQALKLVLNYIYCENERKLDSHRLLIGTQLAL